MSDSNDNQNIDSHDSGTAILNRTKVKKPSFYAVVMLNDDFTTMDFVVHVLQKFFNKTADEAQKIMLEIHKAGRSVCGLYPYDIAATKVKTVNEYSKQKQMPLKCVAEKA